MSSDAEIDLMIATFERSLAGRGDDPLGLMRLAEVAAAKGRPMKAYELGRRGLAAADPGDSATRAQARRIFQTLAPRYHVGMMNDARRNLAWDAALRRAIGPQTRALEIGTGGGMLALMAARAGARDVVSCERMPVVAQLAREIIALNGYADRVSVVTKPSNELVLGEDVAEPVDLIFCDIFGDNLLDFRPLEALADARLRLARPDARMVPGAGALRVALANWQDYAVMGHIREAAGFDLSPFADFAPASIRLPIGSPALALRSQAEEVFRFDFTALSHPREGAAHLALTADQDGEVNGIAHWIRLELDSETALEARPEPGAQFFSSPGFWPLPEPVFLRRGQTLAVAATHSDHDLTIWTG
jgi:type II protein arginine methyltransferase